MGKAAEAPNPPFSTYTEIAMRGLSFGANGGFGASAALPIASLLEEYYLTDTVTRPWLVEMVKQKTIYYPAYGK